MLDVDEINLRPSSGRAKTGQTAAGAAMSTAKAMQSGGKFFCNRIRAKMTPEECVGAYNHAKEEGIRYSPCLECAKVQVMLKTIPVKEKNQVKKIEPKTSAKDPFSGWEKYDPGANRKTLDAFVTLTAGSFTFSAGARTVYGLEAYQSADLFSMGDSLGFRLYRAKDAGTMRVTQDGDKRNSCKISAIGMIKNIGTEKLAGFFGKRFAIQHVGEGMFRIELNEKGLVE